MSNFETETERMDNDGRADKATEQVLSDLTGVYSRTNRTIPVNLGRASYISSDGSFISIARSQGETDSLSGVREFRMQTDATAHETWHDNESDLESKQTFSEQNAVAPFTAGVVINVVEDHYIDYRRTRSFPGQKRSLADKLQFHLNHAENPKFDPIEGQQNREKALVNGLLQVSSLGFPVIDNQDAVEEDVLEFVTWARARVKDVREMTPENAQAAAETDLSWEAASQAAQEKRMELAQEIFDVLVGHLDSPDEAEDYVENSEPYPIPGEIPDDVAQEPASNAEQEQFDQAREEMPTPGQDTDQPDGTPDEAGSPAPGEDESDPSATGSPAPGEDEPDPSETGDAETTSSSLSDHDGDAEQSEDDGDARSGSPTQDTEGDTQPGTPDGTDASGSGQEGTQTCADCGTELVRLPREEAERTDQRDIVTDGGVDMVYVCPDCGQMVDPETGEHQGETDIDQQESGDQEADQSDVNTPEDGQDTDQQEGSGEGPGQSDLTDQEDGSDPRDGEADDQPGGDETAESADGEPGESGEGPAGGQPEADAEAEAERGSNRPDPFDEGDETEYDDERHGVRQFTREDLARERDDMLSLSKSEDIAGSYDIDGPVSEVEDRVTRRYQKIKLAKNSTDESMYVRQTARDERVETDVAAVPASEIRTEVMEGELKNSIEDAFRQLKTRNRYVEQQVGEDLNMDGVITNRSMGSEVRANYKHMQRAEKGDRAVGVALDMSGSMHEMRAKTAIGALYAATEVIGDSFVASGFFSHGGRYDVDINTPLITGPDEEFDWDHLNGITTGNGTPTASGVLDGMQLLQAASRPEKVLVVVTDGKPNVAPNGAGNTNQATDSAASAVRRARAEGIKIIGLGVGSVDEGNMATMFGKQDYLMADMDTLADTLLQIYRRQMKIVRDGTV